MKQKLPHSLKSRALQLLAQREQSRAELRKKLTAFARADDAARLESAAGEGATPRMHAGEADAERPAATSLAGDVAAAIASSGFDGLIDDGHTRDPGTVAASAFDAADRVDDVLGWLEAQCLLSDERFAESRINARTARYGDLRIRQELKQHGIALGNDAARRLSESEAARAWVVWQRRFREAPGTPTELARQARFLAGRGFSPDSIRQVLRRVRALQIEPSATTGEEG